MYVLVLIVMFEGNIKVHSFNQVIYDKNTCDNAFFSQTEQLVIIRIAFFVLPIRPAWLQSQKTEIFDFKTNLTEQQRTKLKVQAAMGHAGTTKLSK